MRAQPGLLPDGLLLVAHGSRFGIDPTLLRLATRLSQRYGEVGLAVLRGRPTPEASLSSMAAARVAVMPLLMARGEVAARRLVTALPAAERRRLTLHPPIGDHPGLAQLIARLVAHALDDAPGGGAPRTRVGVILAGHGHPSDPAPATTLDRLAARVHAVIPTAEVRTAFLAQAPSLTHWPALTAADTVVIVPCFLSAGLHVRVDLPALVHGAAAAATRACVLTEPLSGRWRDLADLIDEQITATGAGPDADARYLATV